MPFDVNASKILIAPKILFIYEVYEEMKRVYSEC